MRWTAAALVAAAIVAGCFKSPTGTLSLPPAASGSREELERKEILSGRQPVLIRGVVREGGRQHPARVLIEDGAGTEVQAVLPGVGFWCDGSFTTRALPGRIRVSVSAGRRRIGFLKQTWAEPGSSVRVRAELAFPLELRLEDRGWYGLDPYRPLGRLRGGPFALREKPSLELLELAASAEGLHMCGVAAPWDGLAEDELLRRCAGTVLEPVWRAPEAPFYGGAFFLGARIQHSGRSLLERLRRPNFLDYELCRQLGGVSLAIGIADAREVDPRSEIVALEPDLAEYYKTAGLALDGASWELPFDLVGGCGPDALALSGSEAEEAVWFKLLNMGFRLPGLLVDARSFADGCIPSERVFVRLRQGELPSARTVADAIREGRVMASEGPFVFLTIAGAGPGSCLRADGSPLPVRMEAQSSTEPDNAIESLELVRNGEVVESVSGEGRTTLIATFTIREREPSWYIARVRAGARTQRKAWTSPIYFQTEGYSPPKPVLTHVEGRVLDAKTLAPLAATVEARLAGKLIASASTDPATGIYRLEAPPAALVEASATGYASSSCRIFFHTRALEEIWAMHINSTGRRWRVLAEERTYELMKLACAQARIEFRLQSLEGQSGKP